MRKALVAVQRALLMFNASAWCLHELLRAMAAAASSWERIACADLAEALRSMYFGDTGHGGVEYRAELGAGHDAEHAEEAPKQPAVEQHAVDNAVDAEAAHAEDVQHDVQLTGLRLRVAESETS